MSQDFKCHIKPKKDLFDEGKGVDIYDIIQVYQMHCINNKSEWNTVDQKDATIIALTIKVNSLDGRLAATGKVQNITGPDTSKCQKK
eukprot:15324921-Ditylum_brightwellii.AAC.1